MRSLPDIFSTQILTSVLQRRHTVLVMLSIPGPSPRRFSKWHLPPSILKKRRGPWGRVWLLTTILKVRTNAKEYEGITCQLHNVDLIWSPKPNSSQTSHRTEMKMRF